MDKFEEYVLPLLENSYLKYLADGDVRSMSVAYFQNNFTRIAARELPQSGQYYFYYQNKENSGLVMCFRLSQTAGLSATMMHYNDFVKQLSFLDRQ